MRLMQLEDLVEAIKRKMMRSLKKTKNSSRKNSSGSAYVKMEKSSSVKVEIRSRKARRIIERTLQAAADQSGKTSLSS